MPVLLISIGIVLALIIIYYILRVIAKTGALDVTTLRLEQKVEDGYIGVPSDIEQYIGKVGTALSDLRPAGKIVVEGKLLDGVSINDYIEMGASIKVLKYENTQLYVTREGSNTTV